jgi:competence protein ComEC
MVPLAAAVMVGIALGGAFPYGYSPGIAVCAAALPVAAMALLRGRSARFSPLALTAGLGYLLLQPLVATAPPPGHIAERIDTGLCRVVGTIAGVRPAPPGRRRFVLCVEQTGRPGGTLQKATGRLRATVAGDGAALSGGERVRFDAKISGFRNFENPGGFDYRRYMALRSIHASAYLRAKNLVVLARGNTDPIDAFRNSLLGFIDQRVETPAAGLLQALLLGDRSGIDPSIREAFNRAGVGHILAISGLHVGIVAGAAFFAFCRLLVFVPFLVQRALTRRAAAVLTACCVVGYGLLAGMSPSTQRAVIMVCTFMVALIFGRRADPLNTLALAATAILVWDPGSLFTISFQLSFVAAGAILYGLDAERRPSFFESRRSPVVRRLVLFVYVSALAILGTLPLTAHYFNRISLVGLAANCLAIPLIGFFVVPAGLLSAMAYLVSPALAGVGIQIAARVLEVAAGAVGRFADLPFAAVRVVTPSLFEIGIYFALLFALFNIRRKRTALVVAVAALFLAGADVCHWLQQRLWHPDLRVTSLDVGQGTASLLELPRGRCILIDGGGFSDNQVFDVGAGVVGPLLWRKKIRTVDIVVLSHPNSDHFNGLVFIVENFHVGEIWTNGQPSDTAGYRRFAAAIAKSGARVPAFEQIPRKSRFGGVDLAVLYPPPGFLSRTGAGSFSDPNNNSVVVKASFGDVSFLFPGDVMAEAEREITAVSCNDLSATVLAAPHHGSKTSSTSSFLDCVDPEIVVVSSGWRMRRYFPHPTVQKRYQTRNFSVLCTHRHGAVTVTTDGREYRVDTVLDVPPLGGGAF